MILRLVVLHQRPLHGLLARVARHIDGLHVARINTGIKHRGRQRAGRGIEVLHLIRMLAGALHVERQCDGVVERAAGMAGHEIGDEVLLQSGALVGLLIPLDKAVVDLRRRLAHVLQGVWADVFRRDLELAGDVVADQLVEEVAAPVGEHIVVADAGADEYLFHARQRAERPEDVDELPVVGDQVFAR